MGPLLFPKGTVNEKTNNKNYPYNTFFIISLGNHYSFISKLYFLFHY